MRLTDCQTVSELKKYAKEMEPAIGWLGGRKFQRGEEQICLNDFVKKFDDLAKEPSKESKKLLRKLRKRDREGRELVEKQEIFTRLLTYLRQALGNWFYDREPILSRRDKVPPQSRCAYNLKRASKQQKKETPKKFKLSPEENPKKWDKKSIVANGGTATCSGKLKVNEDRVLQTVLENGAKLYGVFDGHGGSEAAQYLKDHLPKELSQQLKENPDIFKALKKTFIALDKNYTGEQGSTAIVSLIHEGNVWTACVGDSRALLSTKEGACQLSEDADPRIKRYAKKILKIGGQIVAGRVGSRFGPNVARAIGDHFVKTEDDKPLISGHAKITCTEAKGTLLLCSDGLTSVATTEEISRAIQEMESAGESAEQMARRLVYSALEAKSSDNVSVVVVKL